MALYHGTELGTRAVASLRNSTSWLWDMLSKQGYATLKGEDGCVSNSNMLASIRPRTTHGANLDPLFCHEFARPNCIGGRLAAL